MKDFSTSNCHAMKMLNEPFVQLVPFEGVVLWAFDGLNFIMLLDVTGRWCFSVSSSGQMYIPIVMTVGQPYVVRMHCNNSSEPTAQIGVNMATGILTQTFENCLEAEELRKHLPQTRRVRL